MQGLYVCSLVWGMGSGLSVLGDKSPNILFIEVDDLQNDPGESWNVAVEHKDLVRTMQATADQWLSQTGPVRPPYFFSKKQK